MAVSAVPGSGKTFTLSLLAAQLIADGRIDPQAGQQVLIVTYLNSSADNFKIRLRDRLQEMGLQPIGFDARTLHSMSLEIIKLMHGDALNMPIVIDEAQSRHFLGRAIDFWRDDHPDLWQSYLPQDTPNMRVKWRAVVEKTAKAFIRTAKNERYRPQDIFAKSIESGRDAEFAFTRMFAGIYDRYQTILTRQGALDYDDQVWQAVDYVASNPDLGEVLRQRWPYILEDEAQDSVPLQETLLNLLVGEHGNLVRVGDPNQAITSTFTAAHPRFFNQFLASDNVYTLPLPNSGRNAPMIQRLANRLVDWTCTSHPVAEVRTNTFRRQHILPTPAGDAQPNPPDSEANIVIKRYGQQDQEEIPKVIALARHYIKKFPDRTVAILVPINRLGHEVAEQLDLLKVDYDNLLRGGTRERQIAAALHALLGVLANPLHTKTLRDAFAALRDIEHPAASEPLEDEDRLQSVLLSVHRPESLLYPQDEDEFYRALPQGVADADHIAQLKIFTAFLRRIFDLRTLPIDALTMALGDELFTHANSELREGDLAIAYQIAHILQGWQDIEPDRRLPDMVAELFDVAEGRRNLNVTVRHEEGFEPKAGRITLATQHSAKGLEWDAVFMIAVDGYWLPSSLDDYFQGVYDFIGGDPAAQAIAELRFLMEGNAGIYAERSPTESAHIDIICERLRLLYVGITRAKRFLQISRSRLKTSFGREFPSEAAVAIGELYRFRQERRE